MKTIAKRLGALEALQPVGNEGRIDLDALTDAELDLMEAIAVKLEGGLSIETLPDDDLRFLAALRVIA